MSGKKLDQRYKQRKKKWQAKPKWLEKKEGTSVMRGENT